MIFYWLALQFLQLTLFYGHKAIADSTNRLPSLRGPGGITHPTYYSFRLMSEIHIQATSKTYIIEEWALIQESLYKLDITDTSTGKKRTLVNDPKQKFYYEPFICAFFSNSTEALPEDLSSLFTANSTSFLSGLSALWKYSESEEAFYTPGKDPQETKQDKKGRWVLKTLDSYAIAKSQNYPFDTKFFFRNKEDEMADRQPGSLVSVHIYQKKEESKAVDIKATIRLLESEFPLHSVKPASMAAKELFETPVGYGCKRLNSEEPAYESPTDEFNFDKRQILDLLVVTRRPHSSDHDLDKWHSRTFSMRISSGKLDIGNNISSFYMAFETTAHEVKSLAGQDHMTLTRDKKIWDLSGFVAGSRRMPDYELSYKYEIDERNGRCISHDEVNFTQRLTFEFPIKFTEREANLQLTGLRLDLSTLELLFASTKNFYLVRKGHEPGIRSKDSSLNTYERRESSYTLYNNYGNLIWSGPVAIVRRHAPPSDENMHNHNHKIRTTLYLLSESQDRILTSIQMTLNSREFVSESQLHRELNVGACLDGNSADLVSPLTGKGSADSKVVDLSISYDVDHASLELIKEDPGHYMKSFYEQFLSSLYDMSSFHLDPLQVTNINIDADKLGLVISAKIHDKPRLMNYAKQPCKSLNAEESRLVKTLLKHNVESCAIACYHLNCDAFAFNYRDSICQIEIPDSSGKSNSSELLDFNYDLFRPHPVASRRLYMSPTQLVHEIHHRLQTSLASTDKRPLTQIAVISDPSGVNTTRYFVPSSIESSILTLDMSTSELIEDADDNDEIPNDLPSDSDFIQSTISSGQKQNYQNSFSAEYDIEYNGLKYKPQIGTNEMFPVPLATNFKYQDCESLCTELDCGSFSYCPLERSCQISTILKSDLIVKQTQVSPGCMVLSRDYLSKFSQPISLDRPKNFDTSLVVSSSRDCATECINTNCRTFYFCVSLPTQNDCYLKVEREFERIDSVNSSDINLGSNCYLYRRSYLMEFNEFYRKSLPPITKDDRVAISMNPSADDCAAMCADEAGLCPAFQLCHSTLSHRFASCTIIITGQQSIDTKLKNSIRPDKLRSNNGTCTTFLLSPRSELARIQGKIDKNGQLIEKQFGLSDNSDHNDDDSIRSSTLFNSSWSIVTIMLGSIIGYGLLHYLESSRRRARS